MNGIINDYGQFIFIALGIACVVKGIITVTSGKLPSTEWERVKGYSENGLRKYKVFSAILNIVGGLLCVGISVVKMFNLVEPLLFKLIVIPILVVMIIFYVVIMNICKKTE